MRAAVAKRVGYDPFFPWAKKTVVANMSRVDVGHFVVRVRLVDERGIEFGARQLRADGSCADLLDAAALAIAIAIDPQSLTREPAPPSPPGPGPPPTADAPAAAEQGVSLDFAPAPAVETAAASPRPSAGSRVGVEAVAGIVGSAGVAPKPAVGATVGAAVRWRDVSLGFEGRFDAAASAPVRDGADVSTSLALLTAVPCARIGAMIGCVLAQGGRMRASSDAPNSVAKTVPWWAVGARVGTAIPLRGERMALRLRTDLLVNLVPQVVELDGTQAWKAARVAESLGADVVVHFR